MGTLLQSFLATNAEDITSDHYIRLFVQFNTFLHARAWSKIATNVSKFTSTHFYVSPIHFICQWCEDPDADIPRLSSVLVREREEVAIGTLEVLESAYPAIFGAKGNPVITNSNLSVWVKILTSCTDTINDAFTEAVEPEGTAQENWTKPILLPPSKHGWSSVESVGKNAKRLIREFAKKLRIRAPRSRISLDPTNSYRGPYRVPVAKAPKAEVLTDAMDSLIIFTDIGLPFMEAMLQAWPDLCDALRTLGVKEFRFTASASWKLTLYTEIRKTDPQVLTQLRDGNDELFHGSGAGDVGRYFTLKQSIRNLNLVPFQTVSLEKPSKVGSIDTRHLV